MKIILIQNRYLLFTILTFIGIVLYELNINPAQLFNKLYAETRSFTILVKEDEFVLLDQKTKFVINNRGIKEQFVYMDYDNGRINGNIDINEIKWITIIQGNRARQLGKKGLMAGFLGGFLFPFFVDEEEAIPIGLMCGAIDGAALGVAGTAIGYAIPNITTYDIGENQWQFVNIDGLIIK